MKNHYLLIIFIIALTIVAAGCGNTPTTPSAPDAETTSTIDSQQPVSATETQTPDPCAPGQVEAAVQKVHKHMREFDDASILASNMPREQLSGSISDLQRIRRESEDEVIPACLTNLRTYEVQHMNTVINTLIAFLGGADQKSLDQGIAIARQQHDQYTLELARLLGLTVVPATAPPAATETPTP
jgi:CDP-diacylglycerol pyrophosphatase